MRLARIVLCVTFAVAASSVLAQAPPSPAGAASWKPFQEFNFLLGSWSGTAESGGRIGGRVARWTIEMGGNFLVHHGSTIFPAQGGSPEESIEEVGYYAYDRDRRKYVAHYFYSTGLFGTYDVEFSADGSTRVLSSQLLNYEAGARTRLTITKKSDTELSFQLDIAPSGKDFIPYVSSKLNKK